MSASRTGEHHRTHQGANPIMVAGLLLSVNVPTNQELCAGSSKGAGPRAHAATKTTPRREFKKKVSLRSYESASGCKGASKPQVRLANDRASRTEP